MIICRKLKLPLLLFAWFASGCALMDGNAPEKLSPTGLIATPASYYSTAKARYLGTKYKEHLDRLAERIIRNPKTAQLQFANNISSVGGIGFFTHSATKAPDERYLEVVLATPETFETKREYSEKVHQLFSRYGTELLAIMAGDSQIFQDDQLTGYGLNLTWRTVTPEAAANRVGLERAIIYFEKEQVANFLRQGLNQNALLRAAVIFAVEDNGPLELVSYQPRETKPDFRPAIREDNLSTNSVVAKPTQLPPGGATRREADTKIAPKVDIVKKNPKVAVEVPVGAPAKLAAEAPAKAQTKTPAAPKEDVPLVSQSTKPQGEAAEQSNASKLGSAEEQIALGNPSESALMTPSQAPGNSELRPAPAEPTASPAGDSIAAKDEVKPAEKSDSVALVAPTPSEETAKAAGDEPRAIYRAEDAPNAPKPAFEMTAEMEANVFQKAPEARRGLAPTEANVEALKPTPPMDIKAPATAAVPVAKHGDEKKGSGPTPTVAGLPKIGAAPASQAPEAEKITEGSGSSAVAERKIKTQADAAGAERTPAPRALAKLENPVEPKPLPSASKKLSDETKPALKESVPAPASLARAPVKKAAGPMTVERAKPAEGEVTNAPVVGPAIRGTADNAPMRESARPSPAVSIEKSRPVAVETPAPPVAPSTRREDAGKPATEQLALLNKPDQTIVKQRPLARSMPRPLEGFIIQIAFSDKEKARDWAGKMEQRGYTVSVTEAAGTGALRVRVGNFPARDQAEDQLRNFTQEGIKGIVINLPQAFRPEARSSLP